MSEIAIRVLCAGMSVAVSSLTQFSVSSAEGYAELVQQWYYPKQPQSSDRTGQLGRFPLILWQVAQKTAENAIHHCRVDEQVNKTVMAVSRAATAARVAAVKAVQKGSMENWKFGVRDFTSNT
ncbi:Uncharacterized protein Fot_55865 [Forsythia ovata]|uniref:Uncharacterized protein n=1 Tax=Forsythia ovata TaxID=205694 RepID=A0ABD1P2U6_9LAMI